MSRLEKVIYFFVNPMFLDEQIKVVVGIFLLFPWIFPEVSG